MPDALVKFIAVAGIAITVASLLFSLRSARKESRVRRGLEVGRIVLGAGGAVVIGVIGTVSTPVALAIVGILLGGALGYAQGRGTEVLRRDGVLYARRTFAGVAVWFVSLIAMQLAGAFNRTGVFRLGQALALFGVATALGVLIGRSDEPTADGQRRLTHQGATAIGAVAMIAATLLSVSGLLAERADAQSPGDDLPELTEEVCARLESQNELFGCTFNSFDLRYSPGGDLSVFGDSGDTPLGSGVIGDQSRVVERLGGGISVIFAVGDVVVRYDGGVGQPEEQVIREAGRVLDALAESAGPEIGSSSAGSSEECETAVDCLDQPPACIDDGEGNCITSDGETSPATPNDTTDGGSSGDRAGNDGEESGFLGLGGGEITPEEALAQSIAAVLVAVAMGAMSSAEASQLVSEALALARNGDAAAGRQLIDDALRGRSPSSQPGDLGAGRPEPPDGGDPPPEPPGDDEQPAPPAEDPEPPAAKPPGWWDDGDAPNDERPPPEPPPDQSVPGEERPPAPPAGRSGWWDDENDLGDDGSDGSDGEGRHPFDDLPPLPTVDPEMIDRANDLADAINDRLATIETELGLDGTRFDRELGNITSRIDQGTVTEEDLARLEEILDAAQRARAEIYRGQAADLERAAQIIGGVEGTFIVTRDGAKVFVGSYGGPLAGGLATAAIDAATAWNEMSMAEAAKVGLTNGVVDMMGGKLADALGGGSALRDISSSAFAQGLSGMTTEYLSQMRQFGKIVDESKIWDAGEQGVLVGGGAKGLGRGLRASGIELDFGQTTRAEGVPGGTDSFDVGPRPGVDAPSARAGTSSSASRGPDVPPTTTRTRVGGPGGGPVDPGSTTSSADAPPTVPRTNQPDTTDNPPTIHRTRNDPTGQTDTPGEGGGSESSDQRATREQLLDPDWAPRRPDQLTPAAQASDADLAELGGRGSGRRTPDPLDDGAGTAPRHAHPPPPGVGEPVRGPVGDMASGRWSEFGADGHGRVYDRNGNELFQFDEYGTARTDDGRVVQPMRANDGVPIGYVDTDGRQIVFDTRGRPREVIERSRPTSDIGRALDHDPNFDAGHGTQPVDGVPHAPRSTRAALDADARTRWQAVGAGPNGELYDRYGQVAGSIDERGVMTTGDGTTIISATFRNGRIETIVTEP